MSPSCPTCRDGVVVYCDSRYRCVHCGRTCRPLFNSAHKAACVGLTLAILISAGLAAVGILPLREGISTAATAFVVLLLALASWNGHNFEFQELSLRARWHMQVSWMKRMIDDLDSEKMRLERQVADLTEQLGLAHDKQAAVLAVRDVRTVLEQGERMGLDQLIRPPGYIPYVTFED